MEAGGSQDLDAYRRYEHSLSTSEGDCISTAEAHGQTHEKGTSRGASMISALIQLLFLHAGEQ